MNILGHDFQREPGRDIWRSTDGQWVLILDLTNVKYPWRIGRDLTRMWSNHYSSPFVAVCRAHDRAEHIRRKYVDV